VVGGTDWLDVKCGKNFTVALKKNGSLWAWGTNVSGQYGNNTTITTYVPTQIFDATNIFSSISAGGDFTIGLPVEILTTPIPTASPTPTPSFSTSPTPTPSISASATPTPSPSTTQATFTPTISASPSPTPTESASPTPTPTLSASPTPTPTFSGSPSPTPSSTPTSSWDPGREKELDIHYRIQLIFNKELPINYQEGNLITYAYRVVTQCRPLEQPLAPFNSPVKCPARSILTVFATSVTQVCEQLNAKDWIWKIDSMEKYTKPVYSLEEAYLIAKGQYTPGEASFVPVNFCELGACSDLCVDYIMTQESFGEMSLYNDFGETVNLAIGGSASYGLSTLGSSSGYRIYGSAGVNLGSTIGTTHSYFGAGNLTFTSSSEVSVPLEDEYDSESYGKTSIEFTNSQIVLANISEIPVISSPSSIVNASKCACKNLPYQISLSTNLNTISVFTRFLSRNALTLPSNFGLSYNFNSESFYHSTNFASTYDPEKWQVLFTLDCNNPNLNNFGTEPTWILHMLMRKTTSTNVLDTSLNIWIPASSLCQNLNGNIVRFNIALDVKNLVCIANNKTTLTNVFLNDGASVFTSAAWNQNPVLYLNGSPGS
jgi:hypothetical protein